MGDAKKKRQHKLRAAHRILPFMHAVPVNMHKNIAQTHREWMTALNVLNDPIFLHDKQFRILHCNKVYQQCAGIPLDELVGRPYYEIFPKAAGPLRNCLMAMEGEGEAGEEEVDVDGTVYRSRSFSVRDEQGVYLHSMHILEDITRYKQTEAAFHILIGTAVANVGAAFFRETVRGLSTWLGMECVIVGKLEDDGRMRALAVQRDGKTIEQHAFDLSGTTFNSLAGMGYCEYPEGVSRLHPSDKYLSDMGAEAYVGIPIRDNNGKVNGILCAISRHKTVPPPMARGVFEIIAARAGTEIERKRAEDELRKLSQAVEQSPNTIIITDLDANIEYVNDAFVRASGYQLNEVIGQNPRILHSGSTSREVYDDMWAHLARGEAWTGEITNRRKDGSEYIESGFVSPIRGADGCITHYLGVKYDITEHKKTEAQVLAQYRHVAAINAQLVETNKQLEQTQNQLLQSEKMAAIGLLAAGVAHEINNPIGYVNSNLGTLEKYLSDIFVVIDKSEAAEALTGADNPLLDELHRLKAKIDLTYIREDTRALIAESHQGLEQVKKIILDLKEFSHADSADHWGWADVHQILDSTLNVVWNELKYKCEVIREYGTLPKIYCLSSQLNQVFMNLLVNAAHAIEVRGTITLRTGHEGDKIWFEVADTGRGIPPEHIPHLFDPFFTTKPVGEGTGLGLSVSYRIVEKHHGKIDVQSGADGTTFRVWLPVQKTVTKERRHETRSNLA
ncbi:MAG: PAS domain S-box protein [Gallionella sp.]|nr:PAS domain S-box protein [Gallionella sp.]